MSYSLSRCLVTPTAREGQCTILALFSNYLLSRAGIGTEFKMKRFVTREKSSVFKNDEIGFTSTNVEVIRRSKMLA